MAASDVGDLLARAADPIRLEFEKRVSERDQLEEEEQRLLAEFRAKMEPVENSLNELADAYHRVTGTYPEGYRRLRPGHVTKGRQRRALTPEMDRRIIDLVGARGQVAAREIGEELNLLVDGRVPAALSNHLRSMCDEGRLRRIGEKRATRYGL